MKPKFKVGQYVSWKTTQKEHVAQIVSLSELQYDYKFIIHPDPKWVGRTHSYTIRYIDINCELYPKPINYNDYWAKLNA